MFFLGNAAISLWEEDAVECPNLEGGAGRRVELRNQAQGQRQDLEPDPDFSTVSSQSELQCSHLSFVPLRLIFSSSFLFFLRES